MVFIYVDGREWLSLVATIDGMKTSISNVEIKMTALTDAVTKVSADMDTLATNLDNDSTAIQAAIAALKNAPPSVDVTAAITALEALDTRVQGYSTKLTSNTDAISAALPAAPPAP